MEESGSTLRKDSSVPELYESLPLRPGMEVSPEVNSKANRNNREDEDVNLSKFSDEKRSTLPLHSDSFKKHSPEENRDFYKNDENREIMDTEKRNQNKEY